MTAADEGFIPEVGSEAADVRKQSFGAWAGSYNAFRPSYPPAVFDRLFELVGKSPIQALDLGAGTGQLTRDLVARGVDVIAVEPDERMRAVLTANLDIPALEGSAEQIPLPDASVDLVTCGAMWHWVDQARALPELARVLRPGGVLAIMWNLRDDRHDWVRQMEQAVSLPDGYRWFLEAEAPKLQAPFTDTDLVEIEHLQPSSPDKLVGLVSTFSHVGISESRDEILGSIAQLCRTHPELAGREEFELPWVCKLFTAVRGV